MGGVRRPCKTCLLAGYVYLESGEALELVDAVQVLRQMSAVLIEKNRYLRTQLERAPQVPAEVYPENSRGPHGSQRDGD